jgi:phosphoribosyl-AMP cyclohydrolase
MDAQERGTRLNPRYDANGLITAICTDAASGVVLMLAHMNADALAQTLETGKATFWSRSRTRIWVKGEESGNWLTIVEARMDCDQDAIWLKCDAAGPACHTGEQSCFYRRIESGVLVRD